LQWTTAYFEEKGVAEPRTSAEILLAHVLGQDRLSLYLNHNLPMEPRELSAFRQSIKRRLTGEPNQYITGTQEFWSLPLRVSPDVLIPRPETEILVQAVLDFVRHGESSLDTIIDLGTGSGAVAIALARELPTATVVAVDLSLAALELARENAYRHQVEKRIHFVCGDMLAGMNSSAQKVSLVVSNPPYVAQMELQQLPREIRDFEPRTALDGGPDGLAAIRRIIREAAPILPPGGGLFLEIGAGQTEPVSAIVLESQEYQSFHTLKDYSNIDRVLVATKK
jgi:release factor glutamine methyltransferase